MTISDEYAAEMEKATADLCAEMEKTIPAILYSSVTVPEVRVPRPPSRRLRAFRAIAAVLGAIGCLFERLLTKPCPSCCGWGYDDGGPGSWTCRDCGGTGRA